jgi:hypothetical protein
LKRKGFEFWLDREVTNPEKPKPLSQPQLAYLMEM